MGEVFYLPVEEHWQETMEYARRQLERGEIALSRLALKRAGQMELPFGQPETETDTEQYPTLLA